MKINLRFGKTRVFHVIDHWRVAAKSLLAAALYGYVFWGRFWVVGCRFRWRHFIVSMVVQGWGWFVAGRWGGFCRSKSPNLSANTAWTHREKTPKLGRNSSFVREICSSVEVVVAGENSVCEKYISFLFFVVPVGWVSGMNYERQYLRENLFLTFEILSFCRESRSNIRFVLQIVLYYTYVRTVLFRVRLLSKSLYLLRLF